MINQTNATEQAVTMVVLPASDYQRLIDALDQAKNMDAVMWKAGDVAQFLGVSQTTVYQLCAKDLPHKRIGTTYIFSPSKVREWAKM